MTSDGRDDPDGGGAVERHLDEMFDGLTGTGAAGRRALAEAEDHLRAAVADEISRGLPAAQAERNAVARFGPPARIAGQLRRVQAGASLWSMFSGAWLLTGLALLVLASTYLLKALDIAVLLRLHPEPASGCVNDFGTAITCPSSVPALRDNAVVGVVLLLPAGTVLLGRRLAVRSAGLARAPRRFPLFAAAVFAVAALVLFLTNPASPYWEHLFGLEGSLIAVPAGMGLWRQVIASGVALLASLIAAGGQLVRIRRSS
jgi:hypothetical protein